MKARRFAFQTHFPTFYQNLQLEDSNTWSEFAKSSECEQAFPAAVDKKVTPFQKLLVIQALRPDRLHSAMFHFATHALGTHVDPSILNVYQWC